MFGREWECLGPKTPEKKRFTGVRLDEVFDEEMSEIFGCFLFWFFFGLSSAKSTRRFWSLHTFQGWCGSVIVTGVSIRGFGKHSKSGERRIKLHRNERILFLFFSVVVVCVGSPLTPRCLGRPRGTPPNEEEVFNLGPDWPLVRIDSLVMSSSRKLFLGVLGVENRAEQHIGNLTWLESQYIFDMCVTQVVR